MTEYFDSNDGWQDAIRAEQITLVNPRDPSVIERIRQQQPLGYHHYFGGSYLSSRHTLTGDTSIFGPTLTEAMSQAGPLYLGAARQQLYEVGNHPTALLILEARGELLPQELSAQIFSKGSRQATLYEALLATDSASLAAFLTWNKDYVDSLDEPLRPKLAASVQKFHDRLGNAIDHQHLPLSRQQLASRLATIEFVIADPLVSALESMPSRYEAASMRAFITPTADTQALEDSVFGTLLPHVSGKTTLAQMFPDATEPMVEVIRSGLASPTGEHVPQWLTDASTDLLATCLSSASWQELDFQNLTRQDIIKLASGQHSPNVWVLLSLMRQVPTLASHVVAAYFEDTEVLNEAEQTLPAASALWNTLTGHYGPQGAEAIYYTPAYPSQTRLESLVAYLPKQRLWHKLLPGVKIIDS